MSNKDDIKDFTTDSGFGTRLGLYDRKRQNGGNDPAYFVSKLQWVYVTKYYNGESHRVLVPRFKRTKNRLLKPQPYDLYLTSYYNQQFQVFASWTGTTDTKDSQNFTWSDVVNPILLWKQDDERRLQSKLQGRIQGNDFNLGVALGEGRESLEMIANSATRIARALGYLKHGNFRALAKTLGVKEGRNNDRNAGYTLTQAWLEYRLGWEPLYNDVFEASSFLAQQLNEPLTKTFKARRSKSSNITEGLGGRVLYTKGESFYSKQILAIIKEKPGFGTLSGLTAPSSVAWELVPLSFVVDWFIPIGDWLSARAFYSGLVAEYVTTIQTEIDCVGILSGKAGVPYRYQITGGESVRLKTRTMTRTLSSNLDSSFPKVKPLNEVPSMKRALTALSLLNNAHFKF